MAKTPTAVQPNAADIQSIDFAAEVTFAVTNAVARAIANTITDSGLVSNAIAEVIARRQVTAAAAAAYNNATRE